MLNWDLFKWRLYNFTIYTVERRENFSKVLDPLECSAPFSSCSRRISSINDRGRGFHIYLSGQQINMKNEPNNFQAKPWKVLTTCGDSGLSFIEDESHDESLKQKDDYLSIDSRFARDHAD
jgi:hypothetical protein